MPHKKSKEYITGVANAAKSTAKRTVRDFKEGVKVVGEGVRKMRPSPFNPFFIQPKKGAPVKKAMDNTPKRPMPGAENMPKKPRPTIRESVKKRTKQIRDNM